MLYTKQHSVDTGNWRQDMTNSRLNFDHLKQIDAAAQRAGVSPLYRCFSLTVADGKVHYQVVRVKKKTAVVKLCDGICLDDYCDQVLGEESEISLSKVKELIRREDAIKLIHIRVTRTENFQ